MLFDLRHWGTKTILMLDTFLVEKYCRATGTRSEKGMTASHKQRADAGSCIPWVGNGREREEVD